MSLRRLGAAIMTAALSAAAAAAADPFPPAADLPASAGLPDPLICRDGTKVTSREQWAARRRPELRALFEHYMYGRTPTPAVKTSAKVVRTDPKFLGGKATLKEIDLSFGEGVPTVQLLLVVPNDRKGPAPVFVGTNFHGNHTATDDAGVRLPQGWVPAGGPGAVDHHATDAGRGKAADAWPFDLAVGRGYALATFYCGDIDPDRAEPRGGVRAALTPKDERATPDASATIAWWAWGVSRAVDYLTTDKDIDAKRVACVGHSRLGKTALLATAFDDRIALGVPSQAGCGGTAPSRGKVGESVKQINDRFPHWFCGAFKDFNAAPEKLPFDQHCLVALCAPRPILFSNATEDTWANPDGQFDVLKAADPVYRLVSDGGLDARERPEVGKLSAGRLGYFIRPGKHSVTREDWKAFLDFADTHLGRPGGE
jgi:hypothetical protein